MRLQVLLRRLGHWGELMALEAGPEVGPLVRRLDAVRLRRTDWVFGHHAGASALTSRLLRLGCQRALVLDAQPVKDIGGRAQLTALAGAVAFSLAPSTAGSNRLAAAGHRRTFRLTPFVEAERFGTDRADARLLRTLRRPLCICLLAGSSPGEVPALHRELRRLRPNVQLLVLGPGTEEGELRRLRRHAWRFPGLLVLTGRRHAERVAALRSAHLFLSLAEDDLTGVRLLEAMSAEVPVLAYAAGAVPEVLGGAGLAFTEKRFAFLAELAVRLGEDGAHRARLLAGQRKRLAQATPAAAESHLSAVLKAAGLEGQRRPSRPRSRRPRVAVVVQRYGDVTGGAEALARSVVRRLAPEWDMSVLTTCAKDHLSWKNVFPPGASTLDGVHVRRFATRVARDMTRFNTLSRRLFGRGLDRGDEEQWLAMQGPLVPGLWRHLAEESDRYDGFLAFTYLYACTAWSVPLFASRTLLVPTAHDEPPLAFGCYREVFERPQALLVSTPEELDLISARFHHHAPTRVVGAGVEAPRRVKPDRFRRRFKVARPYLLYVGRVEAGKGIPELLSFHASFRATESDAPDLLLAGDASLKVAGAGVRLLGRIPEQDKWDALAGAVAVVVPSALESLSLLALEAFAVGTPVVANGAGEVMRGQLERSGAGAIYRSAASFREAVHLARRKRASLGAKGRAFAQKHRWSDVVQAYREEMGRILEEQ